MLKRFQSLSKEEKVDFFIKCQDILIKYHPDSEFILTQENFSKRKDYALDLIQKYKGFCYADDNICILMNLVRVSDTRNPVKVIKDHLFQPPRDIDYNAVSIDFVVFRELKDCFKFYNQVYRPQMEHIVFVRHNQVKLYPTKQFLSALVHPKI